MSADTLTSERFSSVLLDVVVRHCLGLRSIRLAISNRLVLTDKRGIIWLEYL
jgi:hypothetical protein